MRVTKVDFGDGDVREYTGFDGKVSDTTLVAIFAEEDVFITWAIESVEAVNNIRQFYQDLGYGPDNTRFVGVFYRDPIMSSKCRKANPN
jgi:hypothetical protein